VTQLSFSTVIEPDGRRGHWLELDQRLQLAKAIRGDEIVTIELEPAAAWPEPDLPPDLQAALASAPDIAVHWRTITPMARWEWVRWITATRVPLTRERRVEIAISKLRSGKRRPCCFDLAACTDPELARNGKLIDGDVMTLAQQRGRGTAQISGTLA